VAFDLNEMWGWIERLVRRVDRLESGSMLENSSITNGRLRLIGGLFRVDSGGRVEIVGTTDLTGPFTSTGTTKLNGPVEITLTLDVTSTTRLRGATTLENDLTLTSGGKIKAGTITITPSGGAFGGSIESPNAIDVVSPLLAATGNIYSAGTVTSTGQLRAETTLRAAGTASFLAGINMSGLPTISRTSMTPNLPVGALWLNTTTWVLYRCI